MQPEECSDHHPRGLDQCSAEFACIARYISLPLRGVHKHPEGQVVWKEIAERRKNVQVINVYDFSRRSSHDLGFLRSSPSIPGAYTDRAESVDTAHSAPHVR